MSSSLRKVLVLLDTIRVLVLARFLKSRTVAHLCRGRWILPYLWFPCVHSVVSFCFLLGYFKNLGGNIYYKKNMDFKFLYPHERFKYFLWPFCNTCERVCFHPWLSVTEVNTHTHKTDCVLIPLPSPLSLSGWSEPPLVMNSSVPLVLLGRAQAISTPHSFPWVLHHIMSTGDSFCK